MPMSWEHVKCSAAVNGVNCTEKAELEVIRTGCKCEGSEEFGGFYVCRPHLGALYDARSTTGIPFGCTQCGMMGWEVLLIMDLTRWPVVLDSE